MTQKVANYRSQNLVQIEANIDDMQPELLPGVLTKLLAAGARDCWWGQIQMKKARMAHCLHVLAEADSVQALLDLIFRETTTFGVRTFEVRRYELERRFETTPVAGGEVRLKLGSDLEGTLLTVSPEFEDCERVAQASGEVLKQVYAQALANFYAKK